MCFHSTALFLYIYIYVYICIDRYQGRIVEVDEDDSTFLVHFDFWNSRFDEWYKFTTKKVKPMDSEPRKRNRITPVSLRLYTVELWLFRLSALFGENSQFFNNLVCNISG